MVMTLEAMMLVVEAWCGGGRQVMPRSEADWWEGDSNEVAVVVVEGGSVDYVGGVMMKIKGVVVVV